MDPALRRVKKWVFFPFTRSVSEARTALLAEPSLCAHTATAVDGTVLVYLGSEAAVSHPDGVAELSIAQVPTQYFLSTVCFGESMDSIAQRIASSRHLREFAGWDIRVLCPEEHLVTEHIPGKIICFVTTAKTDGHYFDFVVSNGASSIHYAQQQSIALPGLRHSGDIESLVHSVACVGNAMSQADVHSLLVVGFRRRMLRYFRDQLPAVCIPCHRDRVLNVVPCPLDEASIQNNTLACLGAFLREGNALHWLVASTPPALVDVDTGDHTPAVQSKVAEMSSEARQLLQRERQCSQHQDKPRCAQSDVVAPSVEPQKTHFRAVLWEEATLPRRTCEDDVLYVRFGRGLTHDEVSDDKVVLPCIAGPLSGASAVALGQHYRLDVTPEQYVATLTQAQSRVVHVTDVMLEQLAKSTSVLINAVFVVHPTQASHDADLDRAAVEEKLNALRITAVTSMAGPLSTILVQLGQRRYFYRGVIHRTLFPVTPKFGDDVTDTTSCAQLLKAPLHEWVPAMFDKSHPTYLFDGTQYDDVGPIINRICNLSAVGLCRMERTIRDLLCQIQVALDPAALDVVTRRLLGGARMLVPRALMGPRHQLQELLANGGEAQRVAELSKSIVAGRAMWQQRVQWYVNALGCVLSVKQSSTRTHDLRRLERRATIHGNVRHTMQMTVESVCELLEQNCCDDGCVLTSVSFEMLPAALQSIEARRFLVDVPRYHRMATVPDRMLSLDALTISALRLTDTGGSALHGARVSLATRVQNEHVCIPLPMLRKYVELESPYGVRWFEECNDRVIATYRILLRHTVAHSSASRTLNISPQSDDLSFAIVHLLLGTMEDIANRSCADHLGFNDSVPRMMRGLCGLLLTQLGSGLNQLSKAWQLACKSKDPDAFSVPKPDTLWIYGRLCSVLPFTMWPLDIARHNARQISITLLRALRRHHNGGDALPTDLGQALSRLGMSDNEVPHALSLIAFGEFGQTRELARILGPAPQP